MVRYKVGSKKSIIKIDNFKLVSSYINMNYKVLSLFSGIGGMDIGFSEKVIVHKNSVSDDDIDSEYDIDGFVRLKKLPFNIVFQNDILPIAKKLAEFNGWAYNYHLCDIRELLNTNFEFPEAHVIIGGFPCQDFSHAGKRNGLSTERGILYQSYVEVVKRVRPIIFVAENVHGLLTMPDQPINQIIGDFNKLGYDVKYQLLKCEDLGIPQTRWRVIIMGLRNDYKNKVADNWNIINNTKSCNIRQYFSHLQEPHESTDPAQQVYSKASRLSKGQGQKEVNLDGYGPTIRAEHHGNIEFRRIRGGQNKEDHLLERRLTVREASLIQTFPPNCILTDKKPTLTGYKPIGNAVPPLLGYIIAKKVQQILTLLN